MCNRPAPRPIHAGTWLVLAALHLPTFAASQNLVPNGDFENMVSCPTAFGQLDHTADWFSPTTGTPDYFHICASTTALSYMGVPVNFCGNQPAQSGNAYIAICFYMNDPPNTREYVEVQLAGPLSQGECYHFEMHANLADFCSNTTDAIGVFLSPMIISGVPGNYPVLLEPAQIQNTPGAFLNDSLWTLIAGDIIANGGEQYLIIGNFKNDASTATQVLPGSWNGPMVYGFLDDVSLLPCSQSGLNTLTGEQATCLFPNPFADQLAFHDPDGGSSTIRVFDMAGRVIFAGHIHDGDRLSTTQWPDGAFLYEAVRADGTILRGRLMKL